MVADAAVSAGVVVAGLVILYTGWLWLDPLTSLVIVGVIVWGTWSLLRDSLAMSVDAVPPSIDPQAVRSYLASCAGLPAVHDLHIWPFSTTENALTAHLVFSRRPSRRRIPADRGDRAQAALRHRAYDLADRNQRANRLPPRARSRRVRHRSDAAIRGDVDRWGLSARAESSARNGSMALMVASGNSSCTASLPRGSRAVRTPGMAASASISARDFGGVSAP